jgi:2-haloalkanoic acid dehalogenase type II
MSFKAVTFDAYGTLLQNRGLMDVARCIVADHRLTVSADEVCAFWIDRYYEATQVVPFRTLRQIQADVLARVLRRYDVGGDPAASADAVSRYVDLFFTATTQIELYPETLTVLHSLGHVRSAIISNADHEHLAAWSFTLPVEFILISEEVGAYKPHRLVFECALERFGVKPYELLHVGDSDVDDVMGAKAAGLPVAWVNRDGRPRRPDVPPPDFEVRDLTGLLRIL